MSYLSGLANVLPLLVLRNSTRDQYSEEALRERLRYAQELESAPQPGTIDGRLLRQIIEWQMRDSEISSPPR